MRFSILAGLLATLLVTATPALADSKHRGWPVIDDPRAADLQGQAQRLAFTYAQPADTVSKVWICYWGDSPNPNRCTIDPGAPGQFTIFLDHRPGASAFPGALAHETFHLLNANLLDCYMEGMCDCFSEDFNRAHQLNWSGWPPYYAKKAPAYLHTYQMMKAIRELVGRDCFRSVLQHAVPTPGKGTDQHIDINAWLQTLPGKTRSGVTRIIMTHAADIQKNRAAKCYFDVPRA